MPAKKAKTKQARPTIFDIEITRPLTTEELAALRAARDEIGRYYDRLTEMLNDADVQASLQLFPVGTRVICTAGCSCSKRSIGKRGTIRAIGALIDEYRVVLDEAPDAYAYICKHGMQKIVPK